MGHIYIIEESGVFIMSETIRKHFIFRGEVQGVGFRYRAYYEANRSEERRVGKECRL